MRIFQQCLLFPAILLLLTQCETMDTANVGKSGTITVQGTSFYPDETGFTYIVPSGAQIVGAGGTNCRFIVQEGGSLTAHSGKGNVYEIKRGGHFRGFTHPAEASTVEYEAGAIIEQEESGPGTQFVTTSS